MSAAQVQRLKRLTARLAERLTERLASGPLPAALAPRLAALLAELERLAAETAAPDAGEPSAPGAGDPSAPDTGDPSAPDTGDPSAPDAPPLHAGSPIQVWCDGSCAPNPGPGGWGAIVEQDGRRREISGAAPASTNNIMEMTAAIEALRLSPEGAAVHVTTDSRYLVDGITRWLPGWKRKGWRKADGKPVLNQPLWMALDALVQPRRVRWVWVEGHTGHPENERCDVLANAARRAQG